VQLWGHPLVVMIVPEYSPPTLKAFLLKAESKGIKSLAGKGIESKSLMRSD